MIRIFMVLSFGLLLGCAHTDQGNRGQLQSYPAPLIEAAWIRNGEPLVFEGHEWVAMRDVENFLDTEVYQVGEYKGVQVFVDKLDIKPYQRLYTKFAKGRFRFFVRQDDDQS